VWLPDDEKSLMACVTGSTEYRRVTNGQTCCVSIVRAMHTRRAVKTKKEELIDIRGASVDGCVSDSGNVGAFDEVCRRFTGLRRLGIRAMPF